MVNILVMIVIFGSYGIFINKIERGVLNGKIKNMVQRR